MLFSCTSQKLTIQVIPSDDELDIRIRLAGRTDRSVMGSNLAPV